MPESIRERHRKITKLIAIHDAQRKVLESQLNVLQIECEHPELKNQTIGHEMKMSACPDCGAMNGI